MPKLILFDCDGTLVDSHHTIIAAVNAAFVETGRTPPSAAAARAIIGLSLQEAFARLLGAEAPPAAGAEVAEAYRQAYAAARAARGEEDPLFPGARTLIEHLSASGAILGVATGKSRRGLKRTLQAHGLHEFFTTLQTADDAPSKPHPGMVLRAMAEVGADVVEVVVVGDTEFDMEMARRAGVAAIGVAWGYHDRAALVAAGAVTIASSFEDLGRALDRLSPRARA